MSQTTSDTVHTLHTELTTTRDTDDIGSGVISSDSGSDVDEEEFRRLASELDRFESPPSSPNITSREASIHKTSPPHLSPPHLTIEDDGASVKELISSTTASTDLLALTTLLTSLSSSSSAAAPDSLTPSTVLTLLDVHNVLAHFLARDLTETESRDLEALLSSQRLAGITIGEMKEVGELIKAQQEAEKGTSSSSSSSSQSATHATTHAAATVTGAVASSTHPISPSYRRTRHHRSSSSIDLIDPIHPIAQVLKCEHVLPSLRFLRSPSSVMRGSIGAKTYIASATRSHPHPTVLTSPTILSSCALDSSEGGSGLGSGSITASPLTMHGSPSSPPIRNRLSHSVSLSASPTRLDFSTSSHPPSHPLSSSLTSVALSSSSSITSNEYLDLLSTSSSSVAAAATAAASSLTDDFEETPEMILYKFQKLEKDHQRLIYSFRQLRKHNAAVENDVRATHDALQTSRDELKRLRHEYDDLAHSCDERAKQFVALERDHATALARVTSLEASLVDSHHLVTVLRKQREIVRHASDKYEAQLKHHRRSSAFEVQQATQGKEKLIAKLNHENHQLKEALHALEQQLLAFQHHQQFDAAAAAEYEPDPDDHPTVGTHRRLGSSNGAGSGSIGSLARSRSISKSSSSSSTSPSMDFGNSALWQYLQSIQQRRHAHSSQPSLSGVGSLTEADATGTRTPTHSTTATASSTSLTTTTTTVTSSLQASSIQRVGSSGHNLSVTEEESSSANTSLEATDPATTATTTTSMLDDSLAAQLEEVASPIATGYKNPFSTNPSFHDAHPDDSQTADLNFTTSTIDSLPDPSFSPPTTNHAIASVELAVELLEPVIIAPSRTLVDATVQTEELPCASRLASPPAASSPVTAPSAESNTTNESATIRRSSTSSINKPTIVITKASTEESQSQSQKQQRQQQPPVGKKGKKKNRERTTSNPSLDLPPPSPSSSPPSPFPSSSTLSSASTSPSHGDSHTGPSPRHRTRSSFTHSIDYDHHKRMVHEIAELKRQLAEARAASGATATSNTETTNTRAKARTERPNVTITPPLASVLPPSSLSTSGSPISDALASPTYLATVIGPTRKPLPHSILSSDEAAALFGEEARNIVSPSAAGSGSGSGSVSMSSLSSIESLTPRQAYQLGFDRATEQARSTKDDKSEPPSNREIVATKADADDAPLVTPAPVTINANAGGKKNPSKKSRHMVTSSTIPSVTASSPTSTTADNADAKESLFDSPPSPMVDDVVSPHSVNSDTTSEDGWAPALSVVTTTVTTSVPAVATPSASTTSISYAPPKAKKKGVKNKKKSDSHPFSSSTLAHPPRISSSLASDLRALIRADPTPEQIIQSRATVNINYHPMHCSIL